MPSRATVWSKLVFRTCLGNARISGDGSVDPDPGARASRPVDGSEDGLRAVRFGSGTAIDTGDDLLLVHAVDDAMLAGAWGVVYDPEVLQNAGATANEQARAVALEMGLPEDRVRTEVVLGSPGGVLGRLSVAELCWVTVEPWSRLSGCISWLWLLLGLLGLLSTVVIADQSVQNVDKLLFPCEL